MSETNTATAGSMGVALVGTGRIARAFHLPVWAQRDDAQLLWAVDSNEEAAAEVAKRWEVASWATDIENALVDDRVDVVDVCAPSEAHIDISLAVLAAGKHLLLEKPAANSSADVESIAAAAESAGRIAMVAENWPYCAGATRARQLLAGGELGQPVSLSVSHETGQLLQGPHQGSSFLLNAGIHAVNLARVLMGEPTHVAAFTLPDRAHEIYGADSDTVLAVSLTFEGQRIASLHLSGLAQHRRPGVRRARLLATAGVVEFDVFGGWCEWNGPAWPAGARHRWDDPQASRGQWEEIDHFVDCVRSGAEPLTSVRDQVRTHRILEAIWTSAQQRSVVTIDGAT